MLTRRTLLHVGICVLGAICGVFAGRYAAVRYELRLGREHLEDYAQRVMKVTADSNAEMQDAADAVRKANLGFCSDAEISYMRDYVFSAAHIRDIGRAKDGKLYCTSTFGRLAEPAFMQRKPDIVAGGANFFANAPLVITKTSDGLILGKKGVSVVMNPVAFDTMHEPPMYFAASLFEPSTGRVVHVLGKPVPLDVSEAQAGTYVEKNGIFYKPICSSEAAYCIAVAESREDMLAHTSPLRHVCVVIGGLLGYGAVLVVLLWWRQQKTMERQLRRAVHRGALSVVYQPIVEIATGAIVGAEALVRWRDETGEWVRPDVFVQIAEQHGFVSQITQFVLQRAVTELDAAFLQQGYRVSINVTGSDLQDPALFTALDRIQSERKLAPFAIGLELTERSTANQQLAIDALSRLNQSGYAVYVDDFGTGYSSLAYLHQLPVTAIKIDRSFTQTVGTEAVTASVVPQILDMARKLDLSVVVEGIETEEQANYFRLHGQGLFGQGWFYGNPVSADKLIAMLPPSATRGAV